MKRREVNVGDEFFRLVVVEVLPGLDIKVKCKNHPEKIFNIKRSSLFHGLTRSCGCLNNEKRSARVKTHGFSGTRLYVIYNGIVHRCYHKNSKGYKNYGQKGIRICQFWNPYLLGWEEAFFNFRSWAYQNGYNDELTIERIDNSQHYMPNNCKFIRMNEQLDHTSRTVYFTYNGIIKTAKQWSQDPLCKVSREILYNRLRLGWEVEKALTTRLMSNNQRK